MEKTHTCEDLKTFVATDALNSEMGIREARSGVEWNVIQPMSDRKGQGKQH